MTNIPNFEAFSNREDDNDFWKLKFFVSPYFTSISLYKKNHMHFEKINLERKVGLLFRMEPKADEKS